MRIWRSLDEVPSDLDRTVVTIGNFDGVHLGHQHVIRRAREVADARGVGHVVAVTFDPHPIAVLRPEHAPTMLSDIPRRVELLHDAGIDDVLVLPFTRAVADWTPEEFVNRVLVEGLHAAAVVVGANFRFGNRAAGDVGTLREMGQRDDFVAEGIPLDGGPQVWSSTYVRSCLAAGDVEGATEALGRPFTVRGTVVKGDQRGRELGYPTANVPATGSPPLRPTASMPAGCGGSTVTGGRRDAGRHQRGDEPDVRGDALPSRGVVRARSGRPRAVRRIGGGGLRGPDPGHAALRLHRGPGTDHGGGLRTGPADPRRARDSLNAQELSGSLCRRSSRCVEPRQASRSFSTRAAIASTARLVVAGDLDRVAACRRRGS